MPAASRNEALWRQLKGKTMAAWVLVPETFHDDAARLGEWVAHAHHLAQPARRPRAAQRRS